MTDPFRGSIHKELADGKKSLSAKYGALVVGRKGLLALLKYEIITGLFSGFPGALGFFLRKIFFPCLLGETGRGVVFGRGITLRHPHKIRIGARTVIDDQVVLDAKGEANEGIVVGEDCYIGRGTILSCKEGSIHLGDFCNISAHCTLLSETVIRLGRYCFLAGNCYLVAGGNHRFDDLETPIMFQPSVGKGGIGIEDDVWLGAGVMVLDGANIGRGTVVGAGSVVTASLPEFSFARGARMLKIQSRRDIQS
jgi:acetyltransferase-like isoleucine patch superfamily enzyme